MIKLIQSGRPLPGKSREAMQWAREVADWLNARQPGSNVQVFTEVFGASGTIYWLGDVEDIATIERQVAERRSDSDWLALMARGDGLLLPGSLWDTVLRSA